APLVPERCGNAVSPDAGAVLADLTAVTGGAPLLRGSLQFLGRLASLDVFGGEDAGGGLAQDFGFGITQDSFRPGIPGRYTTFRVEEEEGGIRHTLQKQA